MSHRKVEEVNFVSVEREDRFRVQGRAMTVICVDGEYVWMRDDEGFYYTYLLALVRTCGKYQNKGTV